MFGKNRNNQLKTKYDQFLLDSINAAKLNWNHASETAKAIYEVDDETIAEVELAKQKYLFLYQEARIRNVHNNQIQPSVIDY
ncbi:hypothetical protein WR164_11400 [Philodulcilactobacillus myokoensis]|uniref:DUF2508 family protein n=1 Tax=Philodulcilactobacillus myokoensis TaxID=2929573 RepID=A0A9W6B250_9LACO|nr:YaaL family protein [Philodulcilactobacillus myokoensis]GLB47161.1 hypothetical protein WR164_11400 [Philodulcilactobacillus myokoensis]